MQNLKLKIIVFSPWFQHYWTKLSSIIIINWPKKGENILTRNKINNPTEMNLRNQKHEMTIMHFKTTSTFFDRPQYFLWTSRIKQLNLHPKIFFKKILRTIFIKSNCVLRQDDQLRAWLDQAALVILDLHGSGKGRPQTALRIQQELWYNSQRITYCK